MPIALQKSNLIIENNKHIRISEKKKYFLEWGSNPRKKSILGLECKNIFVRLLVQMKTVEFAFQIN
jgi:hypothetical protein